MPVRLHGRDRWLAWLAPVVLLAIASLAVVRFHTVQQSSWQGVGFGMFATYEYTPSRTLRATATDGGSTRTLPVPADLADRVERVLTAPGDDDTVDLAEELLVRSGADHVVVEVWGHDVDQRGDGLDIGFRLLRRVEVP